MAKIAIKFENLAYFSENFLFTEDFILIARGGGCG